MSGRAVVHNRANAVKARRDRWAEEGTFVPEVPHVIERRKPSGRLCGCGLARSTFPSIRAFEEHRELCGATA